VVNEKGQVMASGVAGVKKQGEGKQAENESDGGVERVGP